MMIEELQKLRAERDRQAAEIAELRQERQREHDMRVAAVGSCEALEAHISRLEAELAEAKRAIVAAQADMDRADHDLTTARGERDALRADFERVRAENAAAREALGGMLHSQDCGWEERNEGHDWREACMEARAVLGWEGHIYCDERNDG